MEFITIIILPCNYSHKYQTLFSQCSIDSNTAFLLKQDAKVTVFIVSFQWLARVINSNCAKNSRSGTDPSHVSDLSFKSSSMCVSALATASALRDPTCAPPLAIVIVFRTVASFRIVLWKRLSYFLSSWSSSSRRRSLAAISLRLLLP